MSDDPWAPPGNVEPGADRPATGTAGQPATRPTEPPLDLVAVAALGAGLLPTGPVAVGLGVAGVVRTRSRRRRGRPFAVVGLLLGVAWCAVAAIVLPLVLAPPVVTGDAPEVIEVPAENLRRGNCVRSVPADDIVEVTLVPCAQPHRAQVIQVGVVPEGAADPRAAAARFCRQQLAGLDAPGADPLTLITADGQRVACLAEWDTAVRSDLVG
ncbi:hypothetical protein [Georgenia alba]|uniref:DUF4190 domain-containing protein n=1 Tax=Georgenia alba TaxID=2233858 RepID=A0ABW2QDS9_9MICO